MPVSDQMQNFYKKALISLLGLIALSCLVSYLCIDRTYLHVPLLPAEKSEFLWKAEPSSDAIQGGLSTIKLKDDKFSLSFDFTILKKAEYPFASVALSFIDKENKNILIDLSQYNSISFSSKCSPANTLTFGVLTFDEKVSIPGDFLTYRGPATFFSCNENWTQIEIDLTRLETPDWWIAMFKLDLSEQTYILNKVPRVAFGTTFQSPRETNSEVQLDEITLHGRDWRYLYFWGVFMILLWGTYAVWFFRQHTQALISNLKDKLQRDRPLVAYQQLSVEPHRDKEKSAILGFMGTEYANADLDLDTMVSRIGVSRTKINDILKSELGFTFSTYLNKLRLTEAARLLAEKEDANVAEIAYSVGYKNVSYFNKLFKEEYGCTPKTFKSLCDK